MGRDPASPADTPPLPPGGRRPAADLLRARSRARRPALAPLLTVAVWAVGLLPLVVLLRRAFTVGLGADPIEWLTHHTGWWGLVFLLATLAVTPIRRLTGWNRIIGVRRPLGLFAFFYAALHFGIYLVDQEAVLAYVLEDVVERPYITAGFTAFVLMIPLAVTSTRGMIRRLGGKRWQRLHRLVYASAALGVLHFFWSVKADVREPLVFAGVLAVLFLLRLPWRRG